MTALEESVYVVISLQRGGDAYACLMGIIHIGKIALGQKVSINKYKHELKR